MKSWKNCSLSLIPQGHKRVKQQGSKTTSEQTPKASIGQIPSSSAITTMMVTLNVELKLLGDKKVERNFLVPLAMSFQSLNKILQIGFGWTGAHPHQFTYNKGKEIIDEDLREFAWKERLEHEQRKALYNEYGAMLSDYIPPAKRFDYAYDFGDRWQHVIRVGKTKIVDGGPYAE